MIDQEMQHCRKIVRFDPTISTANQGDFIIRNACEHVLHDCFPVQLSVAVPVRDRLSKVSMKHVGSADFAFVCGTNLLSSDMRRQRMWNIRLRDAVMMRCGASPRANCPRWVEGWKKLSRRPVIVPTCQPADCAPSIPRPSV